MTLHFETEGLIELLWRTSWQSFVLAMIVLVITSTMRGWVAPKWRVIMWTIPLFRMVLLFVPASSLSLFNLFQQAAATDSSPAIASAPVAVETSVAFDVDEIVPASNAPSAIVEHAQMGTTTRSIASEQAAQFAAPTSRFVTSTRLLAIVWGIGCVVVLSWWIGAQLFLAKIVARAEPLEVDRLLRLIESSRTRRAIWRPIRCLVADERIAPSSCGFWRPTILLPSGAISDLNDSQLQAIVKHEIEHIRRADALLLLLYRVAVVLHWFNPLVYFVGRRLRRDMELAVDAATISTLDERSRRSYGQLLIQLSQRSVRPLAVAQMVNHRSNLSARIDQLAVPPKKSLTRTVFCVCIILTLLVTGMSDVVQTQDQGAVQANNQGTTTTDKTQTASGTVDGTTASPERFAVVGTVREVGTGKPVADAEIQILDQSEQDPDKRTLTGVTNEDGRYRIEVPMGNVQIWFPALKPGYWLSPEQSMHRLTTTPENPVVEYDFVAQTGAVWDVQVEGNTTGTPYRIISVIEVADDLKRAAWLNRESVSLEESPAQAYTYFSETGQGKLTEIGTSGKLLVSVANVTAEFIIEPGFDNARIVSAERLPGSDTTRMTDAFGKTATIGKATVTLRDGIPLLTFQANVPGKAASQQLTGRVVDGDGNPLAGVRVGAAIASKGGGSTAQLEKTFSADNGMFTLEVPVYNHQRANGRQFNVVLTKDGFAAMDSRAVVGEEDFTPIDYGTLTMRSGCSIPVRVLDENGNPVAGAEVEPLGDYAQRRQAVRTKADGRAVIRNLPSGVISVQTRWGERFVSRKLVVSDNDQENTEVTIRIRESKTQSTPDSESASPIAVGLLAPEWEIVDWSDGQQRKLSDYRGRVVVLDFWGVWCGPCITSIPSKIRLAEDFEDRGVVFLSIHTAAGDMTQINKLRRLHQWTTPTGIDKGGSRAEGVTCQNYGVRGYPTTIIVDTDGRVVFNSDIPPQDREAYMKHLEQLAKESGIQWPPTENADQEVMAEFANQIQYAMLSREIKHVLGAQ